MAGPDDGLVFYAGGSMWPALRPGDRLVLETCEARDLRPGEVVVFLAGDPSARPEGAQAGGPPDRADAEPAGDADADADAPAADAQGDHPAPSRECTEDAGPASGVAPRGRSRPRLICHRVLEVVGRDGRTLVRTQGDCSRSPDADWPADALVGRVAAVSKVSGAVRRLPPAPLYGWRMRHRLSVRRIARAVARRLGLVPGAGARAGK